MYHISDIQKFQQCQHLYDYASFIQRTDRYNYIRMNEALSIVAARKLHVDTAFFGQPNDPVEKTLQAMQSQDWIIKGRFEYHGLRVKIPFMHRDHDAWDIYFTSNELLPKEENALYFADNLWVLRKLNIQIGKLYTIHFNKDYVRNGEIDYDRMMTISDCFYNSKGQKSYNISERVKKRARDLDPLIIRMDQFDPTSLSKPKRTNKCTRRRKCDFYETCFPHESCLADNDILSLLSSEHKYCMHEQGIRFLKDADVAKIEGSRQQYAQIMADRNGGLFVDELCLRLWLRDRVKFPLSFLDFEWDRYGIPPYDGMKPFDVLVFQYSLHILDENGLRHEEFIGLEDCRRDFLESLLKNLPKSGSIIAFNSIGAEEIRLKELKHQFSEYATEINDILERMVDFSLPFNLGMVYHTKMRGQYSLKQIVEVIDGNHSYKELDISKAMTAVANWRQLSNEIDREEEKKIVEDLLAYCSMDTYSLYLLYCWLEEISHSGSRVCQV